MPGLDQKNTKRARIRRHPDRKKEEEEELMEGKKYIKNVTKFLNKIYCLPNCVTGICA